MHSSKAVAEVLRNEGNAWFKRNDYKGAIERYSKAIVLDPENDKTFTNRALCHLKLEEYTKCCADAEKAIEIDNTKMKPYYFLGQAHHKLGNIKEAAKNLQRAAELAVDQDVGSVTVIMQELGLVKKALQKELEDLRKIKETSLHSYLLKLMEEDVARKRSKATYEDERRAIQREYEKHKGELLLLFEKANSETYLRREVPEPFLCKISFGIMLDPVVTPSGITYDRKSILAHIQRGQNFDPTTRQPLTVADLVTNYALKACIDVFLQENPWAAVLDDA